MEHNQNIKRLQNKADVKNLNKEEEKDGSNLHVPGIVQSD